MIREDHNWTIRQTADLTAYSLGSVAEAIMVANWIKTYPKLAEKQTMKEALDFIRDKKMEMKVRNYIQ